MDRLTLFGLFAVTAMLVCYTLEDRSTWFISPSPMLAVSARPTGFCKAPGHSGWSRRFGHSSPCGAGTLRAALDRPLAWPADRYLPRLYRRARHRSVRAVDATVAGLWAQRLAASAAFVDNDAVVLGHDFRRRRPAIRTGDRRFQRHRNTSGIEISEQKECAANEQKADEHCAGYPAGW